VAPLTGRVKADCYNASLAHWFTGPR